MKTCRSIAIDATPAAKTRKTGVEWYTYHLIKAMHAIAPELNVTVYSHEPLDFELGGAWKSEVFKRPWYGWKRKWARLLKKQNPDIVFCPGDALPPSIPEGARAVATIHDLAWRHIPEVFSEKERERLESTYADYAKRASHLIAISQFSKEDFVDEFAADPNRITPVWLGLENDDGRWRPRTQDDPEVIAVRNKYGIEGAYILSVGRLEEKKGIERALKGFLRHRKGIGPRGTENEEARSKPGALKYVLAGPPGKSGYEAVHAIAEHEPDVLELGYVDAQDLPPLMAGASLFSFPSLYEGFGIPMLEAWASGIPVLCSELEIFNEIGGYQEDGKGEWLFNMTDATGTGWMHGLAYFFAEQDTVLPTMRAIQKKKIAFALDHVKTFTWERAARETIDVLCNT